MSALLRYAARGETFTCGASNRELGDPFEHGGGFPGLSGRLRDDINAHHDAETVLPHMISAFIHHGVCPPGVGFFQLAIGLGRLPNTNDGQKKQVFVSGQLQVIYARYQAE